MSGVLFKKKRRAPAGDAPTVGTANDLAPPPAPASPAAVPIESDDEPGAAVVVRRGHGRTSGPLAARRGRGQAAAREQQQPSRPSSHDAVRRTRVVLNQVSQEEVRPILARP